MVTTFRLGQHGIRNVQVVEIWYGETFIGQITPCGPDRSGVRIISKYAREVTEQPMVTEVEIKL